jgi:hypothetical protein
VIDLAWTLVRELGIGDTELLINSVGDEKCRPAFSKALVDALGENFLKAGRYFDPPLTRVAIPFEGRTGEGKEVVVYLRKPKGVSKPPVVIR